MHLSRRVRIQLGVFAGVSTVAATVMVVGYLRVPEMVLGVGQYNVTVQLPASGGLYTNANVTYRGTEVGRVTAVELTDTGVQAQLSLTSSIPIPSDLTAEVHSQTAIGEQYVALVPATGEAPPLTDGDVIPRDRTTVPPDINALLDDTNRGFEAIPKGNLKTVIDEGYIAIGGLGPEIARSVSGSAALARGASENLHALTNLIDNTPPILDTQTETSDSIRAFSANMAAISEQLRANDAGVQGMLHTGPAAADEVRQLLERMQPTLPILLANLVSLGEVALTYAPNIEQLLVLIPQAVVTTQGPFIASHNTKQDYKGFQLNFNQNINLPPPCTTGFLPPQQRRTPVDVDYPDRPAGDLYCRVPQDSTLNVRGARNTPCVTRPGKRAPTVKMCESDEVYIPLNDGFNWKGDPNATLSGQDVPQLPPGTAPPSTPIAPPIAAAEYDPATGAYIGPDGHLYTQRNLSQSAPKERTWQSMLIPPTTP